MTKHVAVGLAALAAAAAVSVHAQPTADAAAAAYQRQEQFNQGGTVGGLSPTIFEGTAPSLYPGETEDVGPQYLVTVQPRQQWVSAYADSQLFYTSNAFLTEDNEEGTGLLVSTVQVAFDPTPFFIGETGVSNRPLPSNDPKDMDDKNFSSKSFDEEPADEWGFYLAPKAGFRYQWYNYGIGDGTEPVVGTPPTVGFNDIDFDVMTVFADVRFVWGDGWYAGVGFEWNRLLGHEGPSDDYAEFYKEYVPNWRFGKAFTFSDEMILTVEYFGTYRFTETNAIDAFTFLPVYTDINDRTDQGIRILYSHEVLPSFFLQPWYRFQYTYYTQDTDLTLAGTSGTVNDGRSDFLNSVGVTFTYVITDWASVRAFVSYDHKDSDVPFIQDYNNFNGGGGVTLSVAF